MSIVLILIYILLTSFSGLLFANLLNHRQGFLYKISLGSLLSLGMNSLVILVLNYLGLSFNIILIFTTTLLSTILLIVANSVNDLLVVLYSQAIELFKCIGKNKIDILSFVILIIVTFLFSASVAHNIYWPVHEWDSLALYDYRGMILSNTGDIFSAIKSQYDITHPPLTSLIHGISYELGYFRPGIFYTFMYIMVSLFFYSTIRKFKYWKLPFTLLVIYYYPFSLSTYSNFPYTIYALVGFVSLYQYIADKNKELSSLLVSSISFAISVWIRQADHLFLVALFVNLLFVLINRGKYLSHFVVNLAFIISFYLLWDHIKVNLVATSSYVAERVFDGLGGLNVENLSKVVSLIYKNSVYPNALFITVIFLGSYLSYMKKNRIDFTNCYFPLVVIGHIGLLTMMLFVFTGLWGGWEVLGDSIYRMSQFYVGLMVLSNLTDHEY